MLVERQYISAEGFLDIVDSAGYEDRSIELVEGEIIEMSKASGLHGQITMLLSIKIASHVVENRLGIVTAAETGFMPGTQSRRTRYRSRIRHRISE